MSDRSIWGFKNIPEQSSIISHIGDLTVLGYKQDRELYLAYQYQNGSNTDESGDALNWVRWTAAGSEDKLFIRPAFPDRPVVINTESQIRVFPEDSIRIYVKTPVWVQILPGKRDQKPILELPTAILSNTFFGSFTQGVLCYWISSSAKTALQIESCRPYLAICPIEIKNNAMHELIIERICLRVENHSIYYDQDRLWSDTTLIEYKGGEDESRVSVAGSSPREAPTGVLMANPRIATKRGLIEKTFARIRDLPGLGIS